MRNYFKVLALPFAILALSVGGIACGGDDDNGGEGGSGGTGGTDNTGGTGGSGPKTAAEKICDHWYSDKGTGSGSCQGFVTGQAPNQKEVTLAECPALIEKQGWTAAEMDCMTTADCSKGIAGCVTPPEPPGPTPECDALCDHIYETCEIYFTANTPSGPTPITQVNCKSTCPQQTWAKTKSVTDCFANIECGEEVSEEDRFKNLEACFPAQ